ncbi:DUF4142 domain-containing protein [Noviherbaspirillum pedocola]|uniref:DUF4142 domain-containing protein n=1 Tax=Noviherbaspirillum pedocola TaxID=2801341 RepID=A0A934SVM0_9BURK|nr:DUF4142 domain-containing protein [Noviherbaspirillum pedocola]MBK4736582.1 DUF4142 domain-containing protein [Noviherbaspirillum pedocola]
MRTDNPIRSAIGVTALAMALCAPLAHAQTGATSGTKSSSTDLSSTSGSSASKPASSDKLAAADGQMMRDLAQGNLAEISVASLAMEKSKDEQVRNYAKILINDHTDAAEKLKNLAQKKDVTLPDHPNAKQEAERKKLRKLSGDKFDRQFLQQAGVADHRHTHDLLVKIQKQAKDQDLIQVASGLLPVIDKHLDAALKMTGPHPVSNGASNGAGHASHPVASGSAAFTGRPGANNVNLGASTPDSSNSGSATGSK